MKEITSINNELIKSASKLKEKKYRDIENCFLVEGYHLVEMAKDYLKTIFVLDENDYGKIDGVEYYLVNENIINKLSQTKNPQGIVAICRKKEEKEISSNMVIMLDNVQDPGNVGTIIRSALAFNCFDIILSEDTVDIYNDKVIRGSQGAMFKVNIVYHDILEEIRVLKEKGYRVFGTALKNGKSIKDISFPKKSVVILGNEGSGVREEVLNVTDDNIYVDMNKDIDSLNVGVAGSIIMYELTNTK